MGVQKRDIGCYEANIEEVEKSHQLPGIEPRTPSLGFQSLATKLFVRQPGNRPHNSQCVLHRWH